MNDSTNDYNWQSYKVPVKCQNLHLPGHKLASLVIKVHCTISFLTSKALFYCIPYVAALFPFYANILYLTFPDLCEAEKDALLNQAWPSHQNGRHSAVSLRPVLDLPHHKSKFTAQQSFRNISSMNYVFGIMYCAYLIS